MRYEKGIVKLRAFVAGSGDMRRVQAIVSETFAERRQALPALSVVQAGALPREGAQVVIESIASHPRRVQNPEGLAFISGQLAMVNQPLQPVRPLAEKSLTQLANVLRTAGVDAADVLRVTCFTSSLEATDYLRERLATEYRTAAQNLVQSTREPSRTLVECEAVGRLRKAPPQPVTLLNPPGLPQSPAYSHIALVNAPRVVITGTQLAFGTQENDFRLAFQRLGKALEQAGTSYHQVVVSNLYPLSWGIADLVRKVRPEFYGRQNPPASTMLAFEGLPSLDASFGIDVVTALPAK
jgi:enamine deaminase RidA (YjgF/YER057c/UK114 family)